MENKKKIIQTTESILQVIWGVVFLLFPLFFTTTTTDLFILPKQLLVAAVTLISLVLLGIQSIVQKKVQIRQTTLDFPIAVFILTAILSAVFAVNRYDALISLTPYLFLGISYFVLVSTVKKTQTVLFLLSALVLSACALSLLVIFSYFKVYLLPMPFTHITSFTPLGSLFDTLIYLVTILCITLFLASPILKGKNDSKILSFAFASLLIIAGLGVVLYQLFTVQKPVLLPFQTGFQIAFATISQDTSRVATSFFFGSGVGTFTTDFNRFRPAEFNLNNNLWFLTFNQSSTWVLELLATTGVFGLLAFFFIIIKMCAKIKQSKKNVFFYSSLILVIAAFLIPFSFITIALFFFIISLFSVVEGLKNPEKAVDLEFILVSLRKTLFAGNQSQKSQSQPSLVMPITSLIVILIIVGTLGYYTTTYTLADITFNQSIDAANNNNGALTYQKQVEAINLFPYRDGLYRSFSQTNLAIASSLIALNTAKNSSPSSQVQTTILNLIQQAINVARTATNISPQTAANWQNLSSVYRSLINLGQNADNFAILTNQQAIVFDPRNPQEYLNLGGIYYQLGQYDNAIKEFQLAVNLKPDYPNAYYNLGHAYEQKGDLQNALTQYQNVKQLASNNKANLDKIDSEISALEQKINNQNSGTQTTATTNKQLSPSANQEPLNLAQPTGTVLQQPSQSVTNH